MPGLRDGRVLDGLRGDDVPSVRGWVLRGRTGRGQRLLGLCARPVFRARLFDGMLELPRRPLLRSGECERLHGLPVGHVLARGERDRVSGVRAWSVHAQRGGHNLPGVQGRRVCPARPADVPSLPCWRVLGGGRGLCL